MWWTGIETEEGKYNGVWGGCVGRVRYTQSVSCCVADATDADADADAAGDECV